MSISAAQQVTDISVLELLKSYIISEVDLGYDKAHNYLLSCPRDGCTRISYCSCDCNDGW